MKEEIKKVLRCIYNLLSNLSKTKQKMSEVYFRCWRFIGIFMLEP